MKKFILYFVISLFGNTVIQAQFNFNPTSFAISDIISNNKIVMTCNGPCQQHIKAYDDEGNPIEIDIPNRHHDQSFSKIKSNPKGDFLFGGFYGTSGDVIGPDFGNIVAKYDSAANLIFTIQKQLIDFENSKTFFSFISDGKIALSQGNEIIFIYDEAGSLVDSVLFTSKIRDIAYSNENEYVVVDNKNNIIILNNSNDIVKSFHVDIDFRYKPDVHLSSFKDGVVLNTDSDVIVLKNIMQDSLISNILVQKTVIRDIRCHNEKIHILSDQNLILSFDFKNFDRTEINLTHGSKYQYLNLFELKSNLYVHENFNELRVVFSHIQNVIDRKSMHLSIEHMQFVKEIEDSIYLKYLKKYFPVENLRTSIEFKNNSTDTIHSFILVGNNENGFNCGGRSESYRFDSLNIPPDKSEILLVDLELRIAREDTSHPRTSFCYNATFVNELPNDNLEWSCDQYTKVEDPNSATPILIYPNPAFNKLTISPLSNDSSNKEYTIFNQLGYTYYRLSTDDEIDISALPAGIYFVKLKNQFVGKFIKL